jgi:hypothetical protein
MGPEPLPPPPRQRRRLSRLRMPSTDECSLGPAFAVPQTRTRHPDSRTLPSRPGFQRFFASRKRKARHRRFRELIARERSAPRAARRLLQSKPFVSTTDGSTELQALKVPELSPERLPARTRSLLAKVRDRGVMGQRPAFLAMPCRHPSTRLLALEGFAPTQSARTPLVACSRPSWLE